jgi:hypothetical protein
MCGARLEPNALRKWFRVGVCWRHCGANPGSGAGPRCEACRGPNAARSVTSHAPHRLLARSSAPPRPPPHGFAPQRRQHTHTGSRTCRRVGPFRAANPPEQAVTLARKMRGASSRGGLPAAAVRRNHPVAALRLPEAVTLPGPPRIGRVPSRSAFFRPAQAGLRREMARPACVCNIPKALGFI